MRIFKVFAVLAALVLSALALPALAQDAFDACTVFTAEDAEKVLGAPATGEPVNPKVKRPKVVLNCTYAGSKDGKPVTATALFRFLRTPDEAQHAFEEARLQLQTKPMILSGAEAFWAGKAGQMYLRKGRALITLTVGSAKVNERDVADARKLAEILVKKL